jgi:hypothetical protein
MADNEEPQFVSLAQRKAALLQQQQIDNPNKFVAAGKRPPPAPPTKSATIPPRPTADFRSKTTSITPSFTKQANNEPAAVKTLLPPPTIERQLDLSPKVHQRPPPPPLPTRKASQPSPGLPPLPSRRPSEQLVVRRTSNDSLISQNSAISAFSVGGRSSASSMSTETVRRLPPPLSEANLPPLPPTKREQEEKLKQAKDEEARRKQEETKAKLARAPLISPRPMPSIHRMPSRGDGTLRPALPTRPTRSPSPQARPMILPAFRDNVQEKPPPMPRRPAAGPEAKAPPPIPLSSRPSMSQIEAIKARKAAAAATDECLICRDFSEPDAVAARYPRQSLRDTSTDYLAHVLCGPFSSPTDKARAIFTWLHHNIDYDTEAFFGNNVKHATPEMTIAKGLAVCGGYAGVYVAIASKAGLECIMVTGHGKGYGYHPSKPGDPLPPRNPGGHAWNAVRIDGGEWKLIDSCWGSGHLGDDNRYHRQFHANEFTASNEDFGLKHYPADANQFFRKDGKSLTWEEYIIGPRGLGFEALQTYGVVDEYGINQQSFIPPQKTIRINATGVTRFQYMKKCVHWDHIKNGSGAPYPMTLKIGGLDGRSEDWVPFDYDGTYWYVDITTKHLGAPGQTVNAYSVTSVDGKDARGMSKREYEMKKGKFAMGFQTVATWTLA